MGAYSEAHLNWLHCQVPFSPGYTIREVERETEGNFIIIFLFLGLSKRRNIICIEGRWELKHIINIIHIL